MKTFSQAWIKSKKPSKQRKYRENAPLHIKRRFLSIHLPKILRTKYGRRSFPVRKGDVVKLLVGSFKGKSGKVSDVDIRRTKVYVEGIERTKKDGTKSFIALEPSNLMFVELNLDDKLRRQALERKIRVKQNAPK